MSDAKNKGNSHIRHLAFQIVAQLPEEIGEAMLVLKYAERMLMYDVENDARPAVLKLVEKKP